MPDLLSRCVVPAERIDARKRTLLCDHYARHRCAVQCRVHVWFRADRLGVDL